MFEVFEKLNFKNTYLINFEPGEKAKKGKRRKKMRKPKKLVFEFFFLQILPAFLH